MAPSGESIQSNNRASSPPVSVYRDDEEKRLESPLLIASHDSFEATRSLGMASARKVISAALDVLRPDILSRRPTTPARVGPTAYLDGLRGVAAFLVVISHFESYVHPGIENCYGSVIYWGQWNTSPAALPFVRVFFIGGHASVALFFIISGYVVPRRLLGLIHEGRHDEFYEALNSAFVRRPGRLVLPVLWSTLFLVFLWHITGIEVPFPDHPDHLIPDLFSWTFESLLFVSPFREGALFTVYNFHTWTIPVELRGSIMLFVWLYITHQVRTRPRILLTLATILYLIFCCPGAWYACFFAGLFTSDLDMLAASAHAENVKLPWDGVKMWLKENPRLKSVFLHLLLTFAMWLAGQPAHDNADKEEMLYDCPGWNVLGHMIPPFYSSKQKQRYFWFWLFWAGWMLVVCVRDISWLRSLFETRFARYLGKHSYALYLVHGPLIALFSERLFYLTGVKKPSDLTSYIRFGPIYNKWHDASWWFLPDGGIHMLEPSFWFCVFLSIPVILYAAEIGTKLLDQPSIKVSNWMWQKFKSLR